MYNYYIRFKTKVIMYSVRKIIFQIFEQSKQHTVRDYKNTSITPKTNVINTYLFIIIKIVLTDYHQNLVIRTFLLC